ncbi:SpoVK/Ycf46/Vps4 family AAA+-type ATPase [Geodermatophilus bullaregiensis]|uniref:AAA family ATPase n=1 Tax=Geodermatophilus bullaregiensis TaxID=1564160 RepID=UPI0027DB8B5F|nr:AAA family ATPase [Geodermatophilus bullaregiensis]MBM7808309.1 SpoVK/Ycf46/Vps4 family AAA+-type ATPase [Geodermatophilus bullaregiensis]
MSASFRSTLDHMFKARFPLLYVESFEEQRVISEVASVASGLRTPRGVWTWSVTEGLVSPNGSTDRCSSRDAAAALEAAARVDEPAVFVFRDLHTSLGDGNRPADPTVVRRLRDLAYAFKSGAAPRALVLLSPLLRIPPELEKDVTLLDFPLPRESEIGQLLESMISTNLAGGRIQVDLDDRGKEKLAKAALGLTVGEAENAFARAMVNDGRLTADDVDVVLEEKRQTIRKSGLLEFIPVDVELDDVGGLQNLKRWLAKRNDSWLAEASAYGLPAPKGVLITGVPGCGKSLTAKAIASAWGLPLLRMDIGRVFSGLVGSSEQNMRTGIATAEAISPCVLWIDEIEKGFAGVGGGGDSGTSSRVFGSFLTWMQEKSRPVFVIATANNIDRLPPEFLRKGRFDEIFFVDLPTRSERCDIWGIQLLKRVRSDEVRGRLDSDRQLLDALADQSEGYSGAEIEQAVTAGLFDAFAERRPLRGDDLLRALRNMVPLSVTQAEQIQAVREWADVRAVAASAAEPALVSGAATPGVLGHAPTAPARGGRFVDF